jgi:class 3 adenylate cyclase
MKDGPLAGQRFSVESQLVVGRLNADITIEDPLLSRRHALIRPSEGSVEIEDLGSLNGTWVNGERIAGTRRLGAGDVVTVGTTTIEVHPDPVEEGRTVLAPPVGPARPAEEARVEAPPAPPVEPPPAPPVQPAAPASPAPPVPPARVAPAAEERPLAGAEDELRPVTALFADIVGSTSLGERLTPAEVKMVVGECVSRMSRSVEQFGGTVHAYMGDGIAAFFGVPTAHEDDPERAARAALRILDVVRAYAEEVEAAWGISDFSARVGINTGETAVGLVGAADPQAVVLGDTPNVAARLQSHTSPGTIAVGQTTARALLQRFVLEPLGDVSVKGRIQPVEAWRLVSTQSAAQATAPETPLVGRETELGRLRAIADDLTAGRGQILFLLADSGLGKTRLLGELRALAGERVTWMEGRCLSYGTEILYGPFIEMLRSWIGAEEGEAELSARTKLRAKLGLLPSVEHADLLPYLSRLLSLKLDPETEERLRNLAPHELGAEIRRAFRAWIASVARQGPVVLAVEDLHWADSSTRELAEILLELVDLTPLLVVATLRPDPASEGWRLRIGALANFAHRSVELPLAPLSDDDAWRLLEGLPGSKVLQDIDLQQIVNGAEGNPLYLEELVNAFAEGAEERRAQTWAPTVTGARVMTATLESLLLARIDRLPGGARRLAQVAAVVGRSFPLRALQHVAGSEDLEGDLAALLRADIIRELRRYPEPEYIFRHGLVREASLSTMPPQRQRELYGAVGAAFESLYASTLDDHLEVLAHYFSRSPDLGKGLVYLERAAERALALDAVARADELYMRAQKVAQKLGDPAALSRVSDRLGALRIESGDRLQPLGADAEASGNTPG